jgi:hypothetical protein
MRSQKAAMSDIETLQMALIGYEAERQKIEARIGSNSQPVGIALKRYFGPSKGADHRSEAQTQDECGWSCPDCRSPTKAMGCGEEAVRTFGPRRSSQAQAKTEQGWQGRNRRNLEEKVGGKEGGRGEDGTSRRQESGGEESAGKGFMEGREEGCRQAIAESRRDSGPGHVSGGDRVASAAPLA